MQYFDYIFATIVTAAVFWFFYSRSKREQQRLKRDNVISNFGFKSFKR